MTCFFFVLSRYRAKWLPAKHALATGSRSHDASGKFRRRQCPKMSNVEGVEPLNFFFFGRYKMKQVVNDSADQGEFSSPSLDCVDLFARQCRNLNRSHSPAALESRSSRPRVRDASIASIVADADGASQTARPFSRTIREGSAISRRMSTSSLPVSISSRSPSCKFRRERKAFGRTKRPARSRETVVFMVKDVGNGVLFVNL